MSIYEIAKCLGYAFLPVFTPHNTESGFKVTGILQYYGAEKEKNKEQESKAELKITKKNKPI